VIVQILLDRDALPSGDQAGLLIWGSSSGESHAIRRQTWSLSPR
jgi:hypothetical protein